MLEATNQQPILKNRGDTHQQSYFWTLEERVEFVKLLHQNGKKWILISQNLGDKKRSQQQCRSHGQKYLESLKRLLKLSTDHLNKGYELTGDDFLKKRSYEETQITLLKQYPDFIRKEFIPEYLKQTQVVLVVTLKEMLEQIIQCINLEIKFYDS